MEKNTVRRKSGMERIFKEYKTELAMLLIFIVFFVLISFASPYFLTRQNILNVMSQIASTSMLAIGMTLVIITGGIDLSVGANLGLAGMLGCMVLMNTQNIFLGVMVILIVSVVVGLVNGVFIGYLEMPAFIATLGTQQICRSLDYVISNANTAAKFPDAYSFIGKGKILNGALPFYIVFIAVMFAIFIWVLGKTKFGRFLYAIGSNAESSRLSGINVKFNTMMAYVLAGLMCGFAAWIMTSRLMACDPTYGDGNEMDAIAAAVIGGTSMSGGKGTLWGTIVGVLLVGFLRNALNILGINPYWQGSAIGAVIIIAVLAEKLSKMRIKKAK
ncbi:MAG: ABC transporter permease [Lachnospiraceae bacterium]|nr:ABC transporter permease [Lachnospiraceae bacterium]